MQLDRYHVVPSGDHWAVRLNASTPRMFAERADAIRAAIEAAHQSGEGGIAAEVLTPNEKGEFVPLWTFGHDAYSAAI